MVAASPVWVQAQQAVLGSCLLSQAVVPKVLAQTVATDFDSVHRPVWLAIAQLFRGGEPVDPVTVSAKLGGNDDSRQLMLQLMDVTPTAANCESYLSVLRDQSKLNAVQDIALDLQDARTLDDANALSGKLIQLLIDRAGVEAVSLADLAADFLERHMNPEKRIDFLQWGIPQLDEHLHLGPGSFVILGGYPSEGKTALAIQFALHQAARKKRVGIFSLETRPEPLFDRMIANQSGIALGRIHRSELDEDDAEQVMPSLRKLSKHHCTIFRASGMTVGDIHALSVAHQMDVIYIDYVQLIAPDNPRDPRHEQVAKISRALHAMAQTTGISIVALSQLSRPEKVGRNPKQGKGQDVPVEVPEPTMSDLRESGQLEQDADAIMLLWRPYPSLSTNTDRKLKLAKNKEGIANKKLLLDFNGATQRFAFKDPRPLNQRIRDAARPSAPKQMTMMELTGPDPELPFGGGT